MIYRILYSVILWGWIGVFLILGLVDNDISLISLAMALIVVYGFELYYEHIA